MAFPTGWNKKHKIKIDHTKVSGSANLTNFPVLFTEANFLSEAFDNTQGKEIYTNHLYSDANIKNYWRFEGNSNDSKGSANGTDTNVSYGTSYGKYGQGVHIGSSSSYINTGTTPDFTGSFSISVWVKRGATGAVNHICGKKKAAKTRQHLHCNFLSTNAIRFGFFGDDLDTTDTFTDTTNWYHLVFTYNRTTRERKIYVNGLLNKSGTAGGDPDFGTGNFYIGTWGDLNDCFNGNIDDFALFNDVLTATEVLGIYTGGQDIRFSSDASGTTQLAHEVVNWDIVNDKAEVWVKIPTLSYTTDTELYVWYDNDTVTPQAKNDTYGSQNVWSAYKAVWHFEDSLTDSTANAHTLSANGTTNNTSGKISSGREFERDNLEYLYHANHADFNVGTGTFAMQMWWKPESDSVYNGLMCKVDTDTDGYQWVRNTDGKINLALRDNASANMDSVTYGTAINAGTWYMLCITRDGTNAYVYVNGNEAHTTDHAYNLDETGVPFTIGPYRSNDVTQHLLDGTIDEARFIKGAYLTTGWIATEYNNQNSPATFATPIVSFVPKVIFIS